MAKLMALLIVGALFFTGCGRPDYPELSEDAIAFKDESFVSPDNAEDTYLSIEFEGRTYIPYGTIGKKITNKEINNCVGYMVQNGMSDTDERVYTLVDDPDNNYLMDYYVGTTLMNSPMFLRAVDTRGEEIETPSYIYDLGYDYWK